MAAILLEKLSFRKTFNANDLKYMIIQPIFTSQSKRNKNFVSRSIPKFGKILQKNGKILSVNIFHIATSLYSSSITCKHTFYIYSYWNRFQIKMAAIWIKSRPFRKKLNVHDKKYMIIFNNKAKSNKNFTFRSMPKFGKVLQKNGKTRLPDILHRAASLYSRSIIYKHTFCVYSL